MALWRARAASSFLFNRLIQPAVARPFVASNNTASAFRSFSTGMSITQSSIDRMKQELLQLDINSQIGTCMPLGAMRIGTIIHNIEMKPGQGGKLVRAAGTCAKILKEPTAESCCIELPSEKKIWLDSRCRATIGVVSNPSHRNRKLRKAGQSRWLGRRPVVRGVAMNPVDHPHGGGEGKSKSSGSRGKVSRTPWGKPTKCGYQTKKKKKED
ncbi:60S ribosomal protein L2 [Turnera subulata]|uniref:60S ribosomal protein L2 n=1 Tax=Turnera subulata TaxID=218843 RepID=A0A9Q0JFM9_9ROSI|nr:60S ribosomal protein L2 [Turnera subulata]